jgi:AmmeMemoRadiSam system protein B
MISEKFSILPIMVGHSDVNQVEDIVTGLTKILKDTNHILIASSDMHHINDYHSVQQKDKKVIEALQSFYMPEIRKVFSEPGCSVCGRVPISIVLETAKRLGAQEVRILHHTNSSEVTGNYGPGQYTVGYVSAAIC